jgi:hypothetical protein
MLYCSKALSNFTVEGRMNISHTKGTRHHLSLLPTPTKSHKMEIIKMKYVKVEKPKLPYSSIGKGYRGLYLLQSHALL